MFVRGTLGTLLMAGMTNVPLVNADAESAHATSPVVDVWTEPADGYGFLDSAIASAHHSIDLSMYELSDATIEHELIARADAGVDVRVLLNADYEGTTHNAGSYALLHESRVHVEWAPSDQIFHAKYVVIDSRVTYIGTGNLETYDYSSTRDFWLEDARRADVDATSSTFDADFAHAEVTSQAGGLVWSPGSTSALVGLIDSAKRSLLVENEEMDSTSIESALRSAARRGVLVKVVMTESSSWRTALASLASSGVHVRVLGSSLVYVHAKVICVDCVGGVGTVFIGSENFSTSSLSYNRELGVITTTPKAVRAVDSTVNGDYALGATVSPTSTNAPPPSTNAGSRITVTSFEHSISPGDEDSLSIHAPKGDDSCDLAITLPSGYQSQSRGLGTARANGAGDVTWTWEIGPSTDRGSALATVTCSAGTVRRSFTIR
jgi:phosphatidylserine/phosphatidylglycerophosphate/cardiolipin synthase-like enzyme